MSSGPQTSCRQHPACPQPQPSDWREEKLHSLADMGPTIEAVTSAMTAHGYPDRDLFAIRLGLEEAIVNAVKHGNECDACKQVRFRHRVEADHVLMEVEDEGRGFDPYAVPDPRDAENLERSCGRGLFLMRAYMTWIRYNASGNCVTLCKRRSTP
ncbi:MAG TPA: ATP-binding protein [Gemmataceae bacterium]|nr:ATP-binding protein [Gemmataceae bacterium]